MVDIETRIRTAKTLNDYKQLIKDMNAAAAKLDTNSKEFDKLAASTKVVASQFDILKQKLRSDTSDAFRRFFQEQRVGDRAMRETAQTVSVLANALGLSGLSGGLGTVVNAAQQTEFAVGSLGIAAQSAGGKFEGMGRTIMALAGPLSAVGAFGGAIVFINSEVSRMSDELQKATDELIDLKVELGEVSKLGVLNQRLTRALEAGPSISLWDRIVAGISAPLGGEGYAAMAGKAATEQQKAIDKILVQIKKAEEERDKAAQQRKDDEDRKRKARAGTDAFNYNISDYFIQKQIERGGSVLSASELSGKGSFIGGMQGAGTGLGLAGPGLRANVGTPGTVPELPAEYAHAQEVVVELNQGIITMGQTLSNSLAQGFIKGFQKGENVLASFTEAILTSMANIAAQQAAAAGVAGLLSLIPGVGSFGSIFSALGGIFKFAGGGVISEPVYGVGAKSKRGYLIGESGPEMVSPLNGMPSGQNGLLRGLSRVEQAIYSLNLRVDNMGLWMGSERGRIAFENAR